MSQINVMCSQDLSDQVLMVEHWNLDANPDPSLPPGLGRGAEGKQVHHEHRFGIQQYWGRGRRGLRVGWAPQNAAACHDAMSIL